MQIISSPLSCCMTGLSICFRVKLGAYIFALSFLWLHGVFETFRGTTLTQSLSVCLSSDIFSCFNRCVVKLVILNLNFMIFLLYLDFILCDSSPFSQRDNNT